MAAASSATEMARLWLTEMQACVRAVDYARARALFAEDVIAFGTFSAIASGREWLEREQWRTIWPTIADFTFRMEDLRCLEADQMICLVVPWDSRGRGASGETFARPGRATLVLQPRGERWMAVHSHFSLAPAQPQPVP